MLWDLISRAIVWNIWLERNIRVFQLLALLFNTVIIKIAHMLLSWCSTILDSHQQTLSEASERIKRSLNFMSTRVTTDTNDADPTIAQE